MTYTPINWQNGDTITAEKLNKMDNGWSVSSAFSLVFDDSITTVDGNNRMAQFEPTSSFDTAQEIVVILDNVTYNLEGFDDGGYWTWGAPYNDFSVYPFSIYIDNGNYTFLSQTAGTYALKIQAEAETVEVSDNFETVVNSLVSSSAIRCVQGITHLDDVVGKALPFFFEPNSTTKLHIITQIASPCTIFPESSTLTASFNRDTGLFSISEN